MPIKDADIDTPFKNLARAVIGKAISDYCLTPESKERIHLRNDAESFLFPKDSETRKWLYRWLNLAGIDATFFTNDFSPRLMENRSTTNWSGTAF